MKLRLQILVALLVSILVLQCTPENQVAADESNTAACFDKKMTTWYTSFNTYQEDGDDMVLADQKAIADADKACEACKEQ